MQKSWLYSYRETMVTIFYESRKLYQVPAVRPGRVVVGDLGRLSVANSALGPSPALPYS